MKENIDPYEYSAENEPTGRVNKLIVGLDTGKVRYLEGEEAEKFIAEIDFDAGITQLRYGYTIPEPNWKWIDQKDVGSLFVDVPSKNQNTTP